MAVLFLGPAPMMFFYLPLILTLPVHLAFLPSSILQIVHFVLPSCMPLAVVAWYGASRYLNEARRRGFVISVVVGFLVTFGLLIGKSEFATSLAGWSLPMAAAYFAWPWLRTRRIYIVIAAVLCLTTGSISPNFWPLILTISSDITTGNFLYIVSLGLPIGVMTWIFLHRLSREEKDQPPPIPFDSKVRSKRKAPAIFAIIVAGIVSASILFDHFVAINVPSIITREGIEQLYEEKFSRAVALLDIADPDERERRAQELKKVFHDDEAVLEVFLDNDENPYGSRRLFGFDRYEGTSKKHSFCSRSFHPKQTALYRCKWKGDTEHRTRRDVIQYWDSPSKGSVKLSMEATFALKPLTAKLRAQKYADHPVLKHIY